MSGCSWNNIWPSCVCRVGLKKLWYVLQPSLTWLRVGRWKETNVHGQHAAACLTWPLSCWIYSLKYVRYIYTVLYTDMAQAVDILACGWQGPVYHIEAKTYIAAIYKILTVVTFLLCYAIFISSVFHKAHCNFSFIISRNVGWLSPDSKVYGAIMGPTWVLWAPGGPHVGPINLAIRASKGTRNSPFCPLHRVMYSIIFLVSLIRNTY